MMKWPSIFGWNAGNWLEMLYSALLGDMATLSETYRSTFHTLKSVIYNQLPHLSPFQPYSLQSSINHSLSDHKSALSAVEQPSRHCNNYKFDPCAVFTWDLAKSMWKCSWHCTLTSGAWPLSLLTGSYRNKNRPFPLGEFFRLKVKPALTQSAVAD